MTSSLTNVKTFSQFLLTHTEGELQHDLAILFGQIQLACKVIANAVRRAALESLLGEAGIQNVQGESVKKLDLLSNQAFFNALSKSERVCIMASEEEAEPLFMDGPLQGDYVVSFDPLDGSSNIDANVSIGSIFGISRRVTKEGRATMEDLLQPGRDMVAAGYALYGAATMLVVTMGAGVYGFTLDNSLGEFVLTHPNIRIKPRGAIYSVNEGNSKFWDEPTRRYVEGVKSGAERAPYSLRYIGSMVADVHRTLLYGGVFMYPGDSRAPNGKLRYLYEVAPLSFVIEQAGGMATTGKTRALDVVPKSIHMRVPCFMGSRCDIEQIRDLYVQHEAVDGAL